MDYSPLEKLAKQLEEQVTTLKSGKMNSSELHKLVKTAREVYERLVILEYQALEKPLEKADPAPIVTPFKINTESAEAKPKDAETKAEKTAVEKSELKDVEANKPEEVVKKAEVKEESPETPVFKISTPEPATEDEPKHKEKADVKSEKTIPEEPKPEGKKTAPAAETKTETAVKKPDAETVALSEEAGSIAEKYEQAPIEDIAKAISLNEKFQFIRVLCANNAKSFESLLAHINSCENEQKALTTFATLIPKPEADDAVLIYEKFQELIKRRF